MRRAAPIARIAFMYGICAVCIVLGVALWVSTVSRAPAADALAQAFRADPSCTEDLAFTAARGACRVEEAIIDEANEFRSGSVRTRRSDYVVELHAGGETRRVHLAGAAGGAFVHGVARGAAARIQLFHGSIVRIAANGLTAETLAAPDVAASSNVELPWVGLGIAAVGVLFGIAATVSLRRRASFA